ncbi:Carboxylic ester hydrolase [Paraburkholderia sacchari]
MGINHRLTGFGYTYLGAQEDERFAISGNAGHLDIIQALQWVRDNIEQFGGDPNNVTVFGQSGGGGKITTLGGMPAARGLFHKAIIQSGSVLRIIEHHDASLVTDVVFDRLQLKRGDVKKLQAVPAKTLFKCFDHAASEVVQKTNSNYTPLLMFGPTADGVSMPELAWRDKASEQARDIPIFMGCNSHETAAFVGFGMYAPLKEDMAMANACAKFAPLYNFSSDELVPIVRNYRELIPDLTDAEMLARISTDISFWEAALTQSDLLVARHGAPVYMYECAWKTPCFRAQCALHGVELPFIFNVQKCGTVWEFSRCDLLLPAQLRTLAVCPIHRIRHDECGHSIGSRIIHWSGVRGRKLQGQVHG